MNTREMREAIKNHLASIPEKQIETGLYVKRVGTKYIQILNTWGRTRFEKMEIRDFYNQYC